MNEKLKAAKISAAATIIAAICGLIVGILGALEAKKLLNNQNVVTVNVNGQEVSVSPDEYQNLYDHLKKEYDDLLQKYQSLNANVPDEDNDNITGNNAFVKKGDYIGDQIVAYYKNSYYKEFASTDGETFYMAGKKYMVGFTICAQNGAEAVYNLDGKYETLSGLVGTLDGIGENAVYCIYGDGVLLTTIEVIGAAIPKEFNVNVKNVKQLRIISTGDAIYYGGSVGFANVILK